MDEVGPRLIGPEMWLIMTLFILLRQASCLPDLLKT
jgi:hypothetical protein